jgi:5'-deoxynucleotidase YfbR-like HD superfamily hydrolase
MVCDIMVDHELISLFHEVGKLKRITRAGWIRVGVPSPESVADHSFRCAFFAMIFGDMLDVDAEKLLKMGLIHDLAEIMVGDITPHEGISEDEKKQRENEAFNKIFQGAPNSEFYLNLWTEYQNQETKEAIMIKNLDKLEMAFQAVEYQEEFPELDLAEFIKEAETQIDLPEVHKLLNDLKKQEKAT